MKIAVLSDVHSNLEALLACVGKAESLGVEQYICLGDAIGYGPDPAATLELLRALPGFQMTRGNHEEAMFTAYYKTLRDHIKQTIDWTRAQLSEEQLEYLKSLPLHFDLGDAMMVHASAHEPGRWSYVQSEDKAKDCIHASHKPRTFLGHTHLPQVYFEMPGGKVKCITPKVEKNIPLYRQGRYVINVGSVGQPRDDNSAAGFVIYDVTEQEVTFHRIAYDYTITANKIRECGLPELFADRLRKGH